MSSEDQWERRRIATESHAHVIRARAECADADAHVTASRKAIVRSLELLSRPFNRFGSDCRAASRRS